MRVLVCGGRDFNKYVVIYDALDNLYFQHKINTIITGGAKGADYWGEAWAITNHVPLVVFKANWEKYGKSAGHIRNTQMINEGKPNLVLAFPGGKGTANMIKQAHANKIEVLKIDVLKAYALRQEIKLF